MGRKTQNVDLLLKVADAAISEAIELAKRYGYPLADSWLYQEAIVFLHGVEHRVPPEFEKYLQVVRNEDDPDWSLYQRLKARFG